MALVRECNLCHKTKVIGNGAFMICHDCIKIIIETEKKRKKQLREDKKRGIHRYD